MEGGGGRGWQRVLEAEGCAVSSLCPHCIPTVSSLYPHCIPALSAAAVALSAAAAVVAFSAAAA